MKANKRREAVRGLERPIIMRPRHVLLSLFALSATCPDSTSSSDDTSDVIHRLEKLSPIHGHPLRLRHPRRVSMPSPSLRGLPLRVPVYNPRRRHPRWRWVGHSCRCCATPPLAPAPLRPEGASAAAPEARGAPEGRRERGGRR